ncbi:hypothetical protein N8346_01675 [Flavobacteriaceae bacterium]|nr:hypothetical protein [Flavobacteriaceae bacterium]
MINLESILLLVVIALVLFIDYFLSKKSKDINGELVDLSDYKKKNYFAFDKSNIVYWFPVVFIIIGFFISDDLNLSIYKKTGLIYGSIISWFVVFYYVTFFSYKSLSLVESKNKFIASEILYFFTLILLAGFMNFGTQSIQNSENKFITKTNIQEKWMDCNSSEIDCVSNSYSKINLSTNYKKVTYSYDKTSTRKYGYEYDGSLFSEEEVLSHAQKNGKSFEKYLVDHPEVFPVQSGISVNIKTEYFYDYQSSIITGQFSDDSLIDYIIKLLIIGYLYRIIFSSLFWSIKTVLK